MKIDQVAVHESGIWVLPEESIELAPDVRQALFPNTLYFKIHLKSLLLIDNNKMCH